VTLTNTLLYSFAVPFSCKAWPYGPFPFAQRLVICFVLRIDHTLFMWLAVSSKVSTCHWFENTLKMTGWGDRGKNFRSNVARLHEKLYHLPPVSYVVDVGSVACFSTTATASSHSAFDSSVGDRHPVSLQEAVSAALINIVQPLHSHSQAVILVVSSKSRHGDIRGRTLNLDSASVFQHTQFE
jgi:hypothetical protein